MRASNILGLTAQPFDRDTFHLTCPVQSFPDGRQRFAIAHQNVVRFRWIPGDDGEMVPQTNSRQEPAAWAPGTKLVMRQRRRLAAPEPQRHWSGSGGSLGTTARWGPTQLEVRASSIVAGLARAVPETR